MDFEQAPAEPTQEQLAQEYLAAYEEYKAISGRRTSELRILDTLRNGDAPQSAIEEQQALFDSLRDEEERLLERYRVIGEKLTPETKDRYLREVTQ